MWIVLKTNLVDWISVGSLNRLFYTHTIPLDITQLVVRACEMWNTFGGVIANGRCNKKSKKIKYAEVWRKGLLSSLVTYIHRLVFRRWLCASAKKVLQLHMQFMQWTRCAIIRVHEKEFETPTKSSKLKEYFFFFRKNMASNRRRCRHRP